MRAWILWNLRCRRGRLCADVRATPEDTLPPGAVVYVEYQCGSCGSVYRWDSRTFARRRIRADARQGPGPVLVIDRDE